MAQGVFGDGGIFLLADVSISGEAKHPPSQGTAVKLGTSWPKASLGQRSGVRASPLLTDIAHGGEEKSSTDREIYSQELLMLEKNI